MGNLQPATHGQMKSGGRNAMKAEHMRKHLAQHVEHMNTTKDYGGHGIGYSSQGAFSPGGAAGADYQTTSVGDTPDADSMGPTGY